MTGHAELHGYDPRRLGRGPAEIRDNQSAMPAFANAPMVLQETLIFPYLSGAEFMRDFDVAGAGEAAVRRYAGVDAADPAPRSRSISARGRAAARHAPAAAAWRVAGAVQRMTWASSRRGSFCSSTSNDQAAAIRGATGGQGIGRGRRRPKGRALAWVTCVVRRWRRGSSMTSAADDHRAVWRAPHASGVGDTGGDRRARRRCCTRTSRTAGPAAGRPGWVEPGDKSTVK